ncbi:MAG: sulfatase-like hydrolase/transferase [Planctomycetaceae bacterium]|nr:sulfatase-like hydrolase/transferase [Planctomycetaceae bacterium]
MKLQILLLLLFPPLLAPAADRPNILWLSAEDISPHLGCYGDPHAITPALDQLASEGIRYTHAFTTAGVCAPCRSGIITGMYQTSLGTHHMRCRAILPEQIQPFTKQLQDVGYYCTNNSKTDYQFTAPAGTWDSSSGKAHWKNRPDESTPFFAVFNFTGCHESGIASAAKYQSVTSKLSPAERQDAAALTTLPPYYPDTPATREDWKRNYELITALDHWCRGHIQDLKEAGLYENTIIFFWSDHGVGLPRGKRWLYDSGTHIPLIVRIPEPFRQPNQGIPGTITDELISSIDLGPTVQRLAGVETPEHVQGRAFLGKRLSSQREYVFAARDRMDERYDIIRMVRDKRYKYIRNYEPLKTFYQYMNTPEKGATMQALRQGYLNDQLSEHAAFFFSPSKPVEELYDVSLDPHELVNLATNSAHQTILKRLRAAHIQWVTDTKDLGLIAEPILITRQEIIGNQYDILRGSEDPTLYQRVARTALLASAGAEADSMLIDALSDNDAAVRYWGAIGLGNNAQQAASKQLTKMMQTDPASVCRTAAARALCRLGRPRVALPILAKELKQGSQWERLHAAIVLDEIDEQARPVVPEMRAALTPRTDLYANGKYVIRVLNRALNQLEGTQRLVP